MSRSIKESGPIKNAFEETLLDDYDHVQVTLELEVNDTGALAPTVAFMQPITSLISFSLGGSAAVNELRDHLFTDNFQLSMRQLYLDNQNAAAARNAPGPETTGCPRATATWGERSACATIWKQPGHPRLRGHGPANRSPASNGFRPRLDRFGNRGIWRRHYLYCYQNVSGVGPTWTTTRWNGPGGLLGLSRVNTDKLTLAFARGPDAGHPMPSVGTVIRHTPNLGAYGFTQQQLNQTISTQLQTLQSNYLARNLRQT